MKKIKVGAVEIEVISLEPYVPSYGRGEKMLLIEAAKTVPFQLLQETLDGTQEPIQYFEDEELVCEYAGYNSFEASYSDGKFTVTLRMATIQEQIVAALNAQERLTRESISLNNSLAVLSEENVSLRNEVQHLIEENASLMEQVNNIVISDGSEANKIINTMLGLEE